VVLTSKGSTNLNSPDLSLYPERHPKYMYRYIQWLPHKAMRYTSLILVLVATTIVFTYISFRRRRSLNSHKGNHEQNCISSSNKRRLFLSTRDIQVRKYDTPHPTASNEHKTSANFHLTSPLSPRSNSPLGLSQEKVESLGDFPDYSRLSGVPLPQPYHDFDINKAKPRPYRPLKWVYHQTMCKSAKHHSSYIRNVLMD